MLFGAALASLWLSFQHANEPTPEQTKADIDKAMERALVMAKRCDQGSPSGTRELTVTFAPSGKVASADVQGEAGGEYESLRTCILDLLHDLEVPPFQGSAIRVQRKLEP